MEVLLLRDIKNVGRRNEVKNVNDGYANNFLIPQKKAIRANSSRAQSLLGKNAQTDLLRSGNADKLVEKLESETLTISRPTNASGGLYGGLSASDISSLIRENLGVKVLSSHIDLKQPIKTTGTHTVTVFADDHKKRPVSLTVEVNPA